MIIRTLADLMNTTVRLNIPGQTYSTVSWRIVGFTKDTVRFLSAGGITSTMPFDEFRRLVDEGTLVLVARD